MAKSLWTADLHLDRHNWARKPKLCGDSIFALNQLCSLAINEQCEAVIIAGDFWDDRKPVSEVVDAVRLELDRLAQADVALYFIQGQHGLASPPWLSAVHSWPRWLHRNPVTLSDSISVYGIDWTPPERLERELLDVPPQTDILVMHQVWEDFMADKSFSCECGFEQVPYAATLFTGDLHKTVHWRHKDGFYGANKQQLEIISPGSTNMRSVDEPIKKYAFLLDNGRWRRRQLLTRNCWRAQVANESQAQTLLRMLPDKLQELLRDKQQLPKPLQLPWIRIKHAPELELQEEVERIVDGQAELFFKREQRETESDSQLRASRKQILQRGAAGCLELVLPRSDDRYAPLQRLLSSVDPDAELQLMRTEYLGSEHAAVETD